MRTIIKTIYWLFVAALIAAAAFGSIVLRRSRQLETAIAGAAEQRGIDPRLFVALADRCSQRKPSFASHERYGLLALSSADGHAWAEATGRPFDTFDLFDPAISIEIGAWKLDRALGIWSREADPRIWALAEWHTNRETVRAWATAARTGKGDPSGKIADPRIRAFVMDVLRQAQREEFTLVLPWR